MSIQRNAVGPVHPDDEFSTSVNNKFTPEDSQRVEIWANKIALELRRKNWEAAVSLVYAYRAETLLTDSRLPLLDTPLGPILAVRQANALEVHLGVTTIGGALALSELDLMGVPNWGEMSTKDLYKAIAGQCVKLQLDAEQRKHLNGRSGN
jgi:hypothetical protein